MSCECNAVSSASAQGNESSPVIYRAYIEKDSGSPLLQVDVASISLKVYDLADVTTPYELASITASSVVFDTLQTWAGHAKGFNFKHTAPGAAFPDGAKNYRGEYKITLSNGVVLWAVFQNTTTDMLSD